MRAELLALIEGLKLCHQLALNNVVIETDSKLIVDALTGQAAWPWRLHYDLQQADGLLHSFGTTLQHIFREANSVADSLAKIASTCSVSRPFLYHDLPPYVRGLLALDRVSFPVPDLNFVLFLHSDQ